MGDRKGVKVSISTVVGGICKRSNFFPAAGLKLSGGGDCQWMISGFEKAIGKTAGKAPAVTSLGKATGAELLLHPAKKTHVKNINEFEICAVAANLGMDKFSEFPQVKMTLMFLEIFNLLNYFDIKIQPKNP
jgi:hypothetical protein